MQARLLESATGKPRNQFSGSTVQRLGYILHDHQHIGFFGCGIGHAHHIAIKLLLALVDTGGVDKHDLGVLIGMDTQNAVACGLRLGCDNGHLGLDDAIHQRGFADVRPT